MATELETGVSAPVNAQTRDGTVLPETNPPEKKTESSDDPIVSFRRMMHRWRMATIRATPAFIVNNASNFIGLMQVFGEIMMLKSAGLKFMQPANGGQPNVRVDPARNLGRAWLGTAGTEFNTWQVRSTTAGLGTWALSTMVPDRKDNEQKIDEMVKLRHQAPFKFYRNQFLHGLYFSNPNYKREQIGMGVTLAGLLSAFSGFTNVDRLAQKRVFNPPHSIGGLVTALAGALLWFAPTAEQGWRRFASAIWLRLVPVPFTIGNKMKYADNWQYYAAGQGVFGVSSIAAYLLGGAEKRPDGTIVDHAAIRRQANKKYGGGNTEEYASAAFAAAAPTTQVSAVSEHRAAVSGPEQGTIAK